MSKVKTIDEVLKEYQNLVDYWSVMKARDMAKNKDDKEAFTLRLRELQVIRKHFKQAMIDLVNLFPDTMKIDVAHNKTVIRNYPVDIEPNRRIKKAVKGE
jgi:hypothetical protein